MIREGVIMEAHNLEMSFVVISDIFLEEKL